MPTEPTDQSAAPGGSGWRRMLTQRWKLVAVGAGAAVVLAMGGAAFAASPAPSANGFWTQLAGKLGVSRSTLLNDVTSVKTSQFVAYAEAHGLTAQQIATGKQRIAAAHWRVVPVGHWQHLRLKSLVVNTTAITLNMSPAAVRTALKEGTTLTQLATQHGSSPEALQQALANAINARIAKLVAEKKISTAMQSRWQSRSQAMLSRLMTHSFRR